MAEQELHKKLSKAAFEWTMSSDSKSIADVVMPICKAYAAAQVAEKDKKLSEIRRLCKAFLHDLPCSHNVAVIGDFLDAYSDAKIFDEFKKSVVAARDAEITELKAEIERMREGVRVIHKRQQRLDGFELHHLALESLDIGGMLRTLIESFELSPAPVTEGMEDVYTTDNYPKFTWKDFVSSDDNKTVFEKLKPNQFIRINEDGDHFVCTVTEYSPKNEDQNV